MKPIAFFQKSWRLAVEIDSCEILSARLSDPNSARRRCAGADIDNAKTMNRTTGPAISTARRHPPIQTRNNPKSANASTIPVFEMKIKKISAKNRSAKAVIPTARFFSPDDHSRTALIASPKAHSAKHPLWTALSFTGTPGDLNQPHGPEGHKIETHDNAKMIKHPAKNPKPI